MVGGFLLLLTIAVIISFFAFREGRDVSKPVEYNSGAFAKNRLLKDRDKSKDEILKFNDEQSMKEEQDAQVRYVFASSKKYHRGECRFASKNSDPITLEEAESRGLSPCKICNPHKG